jgi:hypothetical protein
MAIKLSPTLARKWASVTDVIAGLEKARKAGKQHEALLAGIYLALKNERDKLEANLADLSPSQRLDVVNRASGGLRSKYKVSSLGERTRLLRELATAERSMSDAKAHYASPIQMLSRTDFGSERRSRLMQQLEFSGAVEMSSLAAFAVSTNDKELGAALVAKANSMPHDKRPFSPQELAELLMGDQYRSVQAAILEVEELMQRAVLADRTFESARGNAVGAVQVALKSRDRQALDAAALIAEEEDNA